MRRALRSASSPDGAACRRTSFHLATACRTRGAHRDRSRGRGGSRLASAFRAQQEQIRELQRLLGKKTLEVEILQEALTVAEDIKTVIAVAVAAEGRFAVSAVAATLGVARSHLAVRLAQRTAGRSPQRRGRPPLPEESLLAEIEAVIADMPTYGYARVSARLRRNALAEGRAPANRSASIG